MMINKEIDMIRFEDVKKSYTGAHGCMCGCKGKYSIPTHYGIEAANKDAGWEAYDKCSDRAVKMAVNKLNKLIDWNDEDMVKKHVNEDHAWFDTETRTVCVWF